ncbi:MAG TPA: Xaa-Pro peptidase family protein [Terriglobales bacterium]|nr:Xaa-Pro peptidase family protein [Terriglobales bacterium]
MVSRRAFLYGSALAAGSAALPAQAPPQTVDSDCRPLPPSIAALKSMKEQAKPISNDERQSRLAKARELMVANRMDAIMLTAGTSLEYFTGIRWWGGERLFALILPAKSAAFFVCPYFETDRSHEQIAKSPLADAEVRYWNEDESPYRLVAQALKDRALAAGTLGIGENTPFVFSHGVGLAAAQARITSATRVTAGCRMVKSNHEIELMRLAAKVTLTAYAAAYNALQEGMTQHDFADMVAAAHRQQGFEGDAEIQVGQYSALPHGSLTPQVIRDGTILLMDGGCKVEGYVSDISRTFVLGKPSDKMRQVFDIVHRAQETAVHTARPGLPAEQVDAAARKVITDAGYGAGYKYFTHRVGHGMGMDGHEWPYLVGGDTLPLKPNMTFSDEPGVYIRGEFGVRLEDDMHITENGAELFTPQSPSLEHPFANV